MSAVDVAAIQAAVARDFGRGLRDDPSLWAEATVSVEDVAAVCRSAVHEAATSAVCAAVGPLLERFTEAVLEERAVDAELADVGIVWRAHVRGLEIPMEGIEAAQGWDAVLDAVRTAVAQAVNALPAPVVTGEDVEAYIASDARLAGLLPPSVADLEHAADTDSELWGELDVPVVQVKQAEDNKPPLLIQHLKAAGYADREGAEMLGVSRTQYSLLRNRKRPWPGLSHEQMHQIYIALDAREAALAAARAEVINAEAPEV